MNLLLLRPQDRQEDGSYAICDARAQHMLKVLGVGPGDDVKAGVLNGPRGTATVKRVEAGRITLSMSPEPQTPPRPNIDLLLALPRPRSLKKLLPEVTALGAGRIILTETYRVEKAFFGATLLQPDNHRPLLYEGMMQAKLTHLPEVTVQRKLWQVLKELPERFDDHIKLVAHPEATKPLAQVRLPSKKPVLLAIGPEGGFIDKEVQQLCDAGFSPVTMGDNILRVETACVSLMAQIDLLRQQS